MQKSSKKTQESLERAYFVVRRQERKSRKKTRDRKQEMNRLSSCSNIRVMHRERETRQGELQEPRSTWRRAIPRRMEKIRVCNTSSFETEGAVGIQTDGWSRRKLTEAGKWCFSTNYSDGILWTVSSLAVRSPGFVPFSAGSSSSSFLFLLFLPLVILLGFFVWPSTSPTPSTSRPSFVGPFQGD